MYFADTHRDLVWAYDYDTDTGDATRTSGSSSTSRALPGRPDGAVRRRGRLLLDRLRVRVGGPAGHARRGGRPADPPSRSRSRRCRPSAERTSRPCSSRRSVAAGPTPSTRRSPTPAVCSRSTSASAGCPSRYSRGAPPAVGAHDGADLPPVWFERPVLPELATTVAGGLLDPRPGHARTTAYAGIETRRRRRSSGAAPYDAAVMDRAPGLLVIARTGIGYDAVDVAAATRRGHRGLQHPRRPDDLDRRARRHADAAWSPRR